MTVPAPNEDAKVWARLCALRADSTSPKLLQTSVLEGETGWVKKLFIRTALTWPVQAPGGRSPEICQCCLGTANPCDANDSQDLGSPRGPAQAAAA
eukprot:2749608-Amphidinium_carterae.1